MAKIKETIVPIVNSERDEAFIKLVVVVDWGFVD
jgi:hypothetical protein